MKTELSFLRNQEMLFIRFLFPYSDLVIIDVEGWWVGQKGGDGGAGPGRAEANHQRAQWHRHRRVDLSQKKKKEGKM